MPSAIPTHVAQGKISTGIEPGFRHFEHRLRVLVASSRTSERRLADDIYVHDVAGTLIDSLAGTLQSLRPAEGESLAAQ